MSYYHLQPDDSTFPQQLKELLTVIQESEGQLKLEVADLTSQLETEIRDRETEREAWKENIRILQEQIEGSDYTLVL